MPVWAVLKQFQTYLLIISSVTSNCECINRAYSVIECIMNTTYNGQIVQRQTKFETQNLERQGHQFDILNH